uniref:Uncharacterized protein n=1 Tax=Picea glauca TaxID=3330 RepID=A0A101M0K3_PICGL|nr:hypothetical protein ABT39_MTgene4744 [Picea glauca]QHR89608.1 hypothetical protein Q903MT_gene3630 [Picea sitchensis]
MVLGDNGNSQPVIIELTSSYKSTSIYQLSELNHLSEQIDPARNYIIRFSGWIRHQWHTLIHLAVVRLVILYPQSAIFHTRTCR